MTELATMPAIVVRRTIEAPAGELFDAWLDPALVAVWMRPGTFRDSVVRIDARVGGSFEIRMQGPGGEVPHRGVYRRIDRPRQLVYTWISPHTREKETLVTVDFIVRGKATEIVITHEMLPDEQAMRGHTDGWTHIVARLAGENTAFGAGCATG